MSFWRFLLAWLTQAFHVSSHAGHIIHQGSVFLTGLLIVTGVALGVHAEHGGGEPLMLVVAPFVGSWLTFALGLVWHAYRLYRQEFDQRVSSEKQANDALHEIYENIRRIGTRTLRCAAREGIVRLMWEGHALAIDCREGNGDFIEQRVADWEQRAANFLQNCSEALDAQALQRFRNVEGIQPVELWNVPAESHGPANTLHCRFTRLSELDAELQIEAQPPPIPNPIITTDELPSSTPLWQYVVSWVAALVTEILRGSEEIRSKRYRNSDRHQAIGQQATWDKGRPGDAGSASRGGNA